MSVSNYALSISPGVEQLLILDAKNVLGESCVIDDNGGDWFQEELDQFFNKCWPFRLPAERVKIYDVEQ